MLHEERNGFLPCIDHSPYKSPVNWVTNRYQRTSTDKKKVGGQSTPRDAKYSIDGHKKLSKQKLKPVPNDIYQRLTVKTYVTNRLDVPEEVNLSRWPENQKHFRGSTTYKVPSYNQQINIVHENPSEKYSKDDDRIYLTIEEVSAISQLQERLVQALSQSTNQVVDIHPDISPKPSSYNLPNSIEKESSFLQQEPIKHPMKPDSALKPSRCVVQKTTQDETKDEGTPEKWMSSLPTYRLSTRQLKEHKNSLQKQQHDSFQELSDRMVYKSFDSSPGPVKSFESPKEQVAPCKITNEDVSSVGVFADPSAPKTTNSNSVAALLSDIRNPTGKRKLKSYTGNDANSSSLDEGKKIEEENTAFSELKQIIDSLRIPVFTIRYCDTNLLEIFEETVAKFNNFDRKDVKLLGRGKFAAVYRIPLKHGDSDISFGGNRSSVAVNCAFKVAQFKTNDIFTFNSFCNESKTLHEIPSKRIIYEFRSELYALWKISPHRNVVRGLGFLSRPFGLVMECVEGLNLFGLLEDENWQRETSKLVRISLLLDIISGLAHIHQHQFVHRDIKPHNIIVEKCDGKFCAKIADMGTAFELTQTPFELKYRKENSMNSSSYKLCYEPIGTMGYSAPEIINPDQSKVAYDYSVDVFAFGIISWELLITCEHLNLKRNPISELSPDVAYNRMIEGLRPSLIDECHRPQSLSVLISLCWEGTAQNRPLSVEIQSQLQTICSKFLNS